MTVDDLYAAPLEKFVETRDQLARELTESGEAEEAKRVKGLRKPTVTAWTLNRVARDRPELVSELVSLHQRMRSASSATELRAASEERMATIRQVVEAAEGVSEAVRKKMRSTLLAAGADPSAEAALREGRLERELEPTGLGGFEVGAGFAWTPAPVDRGESARMQRARGRADRLRREAEEAAEEARTLRETADRAERLAATAEKRAAEKRRAADEALRSLES